MPGNGKPGDVLPGDPVAPVATVVVAHRLLLVRHGNTFGPGETPVWVGARTDLPLVARGEEQARALGTALRDAGIVPRRLIAGPLQRTRRHLEIAAATAGLAEPVTVDKRLIEIDYGAWEGRSNAEIAAQPGGQAAMDRWARESIWPDDAGWSPSAAAIAARLRALADQITASGVAAGSDEAAPPPTTVVCSSNGVLRYALALVLGGLDRAVAEGTAKMATGALAQLSYRGAPGHRAAAGSAGAWRLDFWNRQPDSIVLDQ